MIEFAVLICVGGGQLPVSGLGGHAACDAEERDDGEERAHRHRAVGILTTTAAYGQTNPLWLADASHADVTPGPRDLTKAEAISWPLCSAHDNGTVHALRRGSSPSGREKNRFGMIRPSPITALTVENTKESSISIFSASPQRASRAIGDRDLRVTIQKPIHPVCTFGSPSDSIAAITPPCILPTVSQTIALRYERSVSFDNMLVRKFRFKRREK